MSEGSRAPAIYSQIGLRQIMMLNRLLDGFEGKLTTTKWANIARCSQDTAYRDILQLVEYGILQKGEAGGGARHPLRTDCRAGEMKPEIQALEENSRAFLLFDFCRDLAII